MYKRQKKSGEKQIATQYLDFVISYISIKSNSNFK